MSAADLSASHNAVANTALRTIIQQAQNAGGGNTDILVVTESIVAGVILYVSKVDSRAHEAVSAALFDGVRERVAELAAKVAPTPVGSA